MLSTFSNLIDDVVKADHKRVDPVRIGSLQHCSFPSVFVRRAHFFHIMNKVEELTKDHGGVSDLRVIRFEEIFLEEDVDRC